MILLAVASVASARPGAILAEKTIEAHGNSVVHYSAPIVAPAPAVFAHQVEPLVPAAILAEKVIEHHGHSIVHHAAPVLPYAAPISHYGHGIVGHNFVAPIVW